MSEQYLLYCFQGEKLVQCESFWAPHDEGAIDGGETRREGKHAELWQGSRKVKIFHPAPEIDLGSKQSDQEQYG